MWKSTEELLTSIHKATERLNRGDIPVDEAHAEARLLTVAAKIIGIRLDHARMTGRLNQGSPNLPDMVLSGKNKDTK